jgi:hypothetical protein
LLIVINLTTVVNVFHLFLENVYDLFFYMKKPLLNFHQRCLAPGLFLFVLALFFSTTILAQSEHAKWTWSVNQTGPCEAELVMKADVENGWHIFALVAHDKDDGPQETFFTFDANPSYELVGKVIETQTPIKRFEKDFGTDGVNTFLFVGSITWKQKIKIKSPTDFKVTGIVEGQTCTEGDAGMCVLLKAAMSFNIKGCSGAVAPTGVI